MPYASWWTLFTNDDIGERGLLLPAVTLLADFIWMVRDPETNGGLPFEHSATRRTGYFDALGVLWDSPRNHFVVLYRCSQENRGCLPAQSDIQRRWFDGQWNSRCSDFENYCLGIRWLKTKIMAIRVIAGAAVFLTWNFVDLENCLKILYKYLR